MIEVSVITGGDPRYRELCSMQGALFDEWCAAWDRLGLSERDMYTHPMYVMSWVDAHLKTDGSTYILLHLADDGATITIIPFKRRRVIPGLGTVLVSPVVEVGSSAALPAHCREEAVDAMFAARVSSNTPMAIGFGRIDETNRFGDVAAVKLVSINGYSRNCISLPDQYEALIAAKTKLRRNLGVARRKAERQGRLSVDVVDDPGHLSAAFEQFVALEYAGWKQNERRAMKNNAFIRTFYRNITETFGRCGCAAVITMRLDGVPLSSYLCLIHDHVLYGLKTAFNETCRHLSPGNLLLHHILTDYCPDHDIRMYNTMSNSPWFRKQYDPSLLNTYSLYLFPPGFRGSFANQAARLFTGLREVRRHD